MKTYSVASEQRRNMKFNVKFRYLDTPDFIGDPVIHNNQTEFTFLEAVELANKMNNESNTPFYYWVDEIIVTSGCHYKEAMLNNLLLQEQNA